MRHPLLEIGKIVNTHALRGEVKVIPWTDDAAIWDQLESVYLEKQEEKLDIQAVRSQKGNLILKFVGIDTIEQAQLLRDRVLYAERSVLGEPPEGRYYICDLLGIEVFADTGEKLGTVKEVFPTGSSYVYTIKRQGEKDMLIPAIPEVVLQVDIDEGKMVIHIIEGLDEL